jgi:hypothetical protein
LSTARAPARDLEAAAERELVDNGSKADRSTRVALAGRSVDPDGAACGGIPAGGVEGLIETAGPGAAEGAGDAAGAGIAGGVGGFAAAGAEDRVKRAFGIRSISAFTSGHSLSVRVR